MALTPLSNVRFQSRSIWAIAVTAVLLAVFFYVVSPWETSDPDSQGKPARAPKAVTAAQPAESKPTGLEAVRLATTLQEIPTTIRSLVEGPGDALDVDAILSSAQSPEGAATAPLLLLHAAEELYAAGCYSESLTMLELAWEKARTHTPQDWTEDKLVARIAARLGELYARLGRMEKLQQVLVEMDNRPIEGAETLAFTNLRHAMDSMRNFPEHSFKCGPLALGKIFATLHPAAAEPGRITEAASPRTGFSIAAVVELGQEIGLPVKAVRPDSGKIPVPSVVHWRSDHYAAITQLNEGRCLVEDPTFQRSVWMTPEAIRRETSGWFIVPEDLVDPAWTVA
jgi:hypothetical protein